MHFRDITLHQFSLVLAELSDVEHHAGMIETVSGQHCALGMTILAWDGSHGMALVDDPRHLDNLPAGLASEAADAVGSEITLPATHEPGPRDREFKDAG